MKGLRPSISPMFYLSDRSINRQGLGRMPTGAPGLLALQATANRRGKFSDGPKPSITKAVIARAWRSACCCAVSTSPL